MLCRCLLAYLTPGRRKGAGTHQDDSYQCENQTRCTYKHEPHACTEKVEHPSYGTAAGKSAFFQSSDCHQENLGNRLRSGCPGLGGEVHVYRGWAVAARTLIDGT